MTAALRQRRVRMQTKDGGSARSRFDAVFISCWRLRFVEPVKPPAFDAWPLPRTSRRTLPACRPAPPRQNRYIPATNTTPENSSVVTQYPMMSRTPSPAIASAGSAQNGCAMLVHASPYAIAIAALPRSAPSA